MYRAHVEAPGRTFPELTVYVDADSAVEACGRIKQVCTAIGYAPRTEDEGWRIHEIRSAIDLLDTGNSALSHLRLFEKGSNAEGAPVWIRAPIFAIRDPLELLGLWSDLAHWKRR